MSDVGIGNGLEVPKDGWGEKDGLYLALAPPKLARASDARRRSVSASWTASWARNLVSSEEPPKAEFPVLKGVRVSSLH